MNNTVPTPTQVPGTPAPGQLSNLSLYANAPAPCSCDPEHPDWDIPDDATCLAYWGRYDMPEHIRGHSLLVARVATFLALGAREAGLSVSVPTVRASALLHDLAKAFTIEHGGSHSQLGASWAVSLTKNPALAQGVLHHVYWPYEVDIRKYFLPLAVIYGDKRVQHNDLVSLERRFKDLLDRYGKTEDLRKRIGLAHAQARELERLFGRLLEKELHASTFDCGRLVERA